MIFENETGRPYPERMSAYRLLQRSKILRTLERGRQERRRSKPPRKPRGWDIGPPGFVGVGVQRAGTTWWYELIQEHPDVVRRYPKELHFFNRRATDSDGMTLREAYWAYFPRPPGRLVGEWTPGYIHRESVPRLLATAAPGSKFLVMLRDPVERYRSGIALQKDLWSSRIPEKIQERAFVRGFYAEQLERFFSTIPPDRALILQYERCRQDPASELSRTYDFLGLDKSFLPNRLNRVRNPSVEMKPELHPDLHSRLVEVYEPDVRRLSDMLEELDLRLWPNFGHLAA